MRRFLFLLLPCLSACSPLHVPPAPDRHLAQAMASPSPAAVSGLPPLADQSLFLPPSASSIPRQRYSVVVNQMPARELLFMLARDAQLNLDVHPDIQGRVTLNAVQQTLPQILARVARQVDMRYTLEQGVLSVTPDRPFIRSYNVDYVNVARSAQGKVAISTSVAATGGSVGNTSAGSSGQNSSSTEVSNLSENRFWERLEANLRTLLAASRRSQQQALPAAAESAPGEERLRLAQAVASAGNGAPQLLTTLLGSKEHPRSEGGDVIVHPESGVLSVYASAAEHEQIRDYLERVAAGARRQVLIEATIVEVNLGDRYQAGIDWSLLSQKDSHFSISQTLNSNQFADSPLTVLNYSNPASSLLGGASLSATIKLLEQFGTTKVLSSPRIMALNNQTALLKVVDEKVYFTTRLEVTAATSTAPERREYQSEVHTVPVGVVMSVTPQIGAGAMVSLNVRPTISRITGYKLDPALRLSGSEVDNLIPEIQVRELESTLKLADGQTAVLGGLIQDQAETSRSGWPWLSRLPWGLGDLFSYRDDSTGKSELVIFMRPILAPETRLSLADLPTLHQAETSPAVRP